MELFSYFLFLIGHYYCIEKQQISVYYSEFLFSWTVFHIGQNFWATAPSALFYWYINFLQLL